MTLGLKVIADGYLANEPLVAINWLLSSYTYVTLRRNKNLGGYEYVQVDGSWGSGNNAKFIGESRSPLVLGELPMSSFLDEDVIAGDAVEYGVEADSSGIWESNSIVVGRLFVGAASSPVKATITDNKGVAISSKVYNGNWRLNSSAILQLDPDSLGRVDMSSVAFGGATNIDDDHIRFEYGESILADDSDDVDSLQIKFHLTGAALSDRSMFGYTITPNGSVLKVDGPTGWPNGAWRFTDTNYITYPGQGPITQRINSAIYIKICFRAFPVTTGNGATFVYNVNTQYGNASIPQLNINNLGQVYFTYGNSGKLCTARSLSLDTWYELMVSIVDDVTYFAIDGTIVDSQATTLFDAWRLSGNAQAIKGSAAMTYDIAEYIHLFGTDVGHNTNYVIPTSSRETLETRRSASALQTYDPSIIYHLLGSSLLDRSVYQRANLAGTGSVDTNKNCPAGWPSGAIIASTTRIRPAAMPNLSGDFTLFFAYGNRTAGIIAGDPSGNGYITINADASNFYLYLNGALQSTVPLAQVEIPAGMLYAFIEVSRVNGRVYWSSNGDLLWEGNFSDTLNWVNTWGIGGLNNMRIYECYIKDGVGRTAPHAIDQHQIQEKWSTSQVLTLTELRSKQPTKRYVNIRALMRTDATNTDECGFTYMGANPVPPDLIISAIPGDF